MSDNTPENKPQNQPRESSKDQSLSRKDFLQKAGSSLVGFGIYALTPSLLTLNFSSCREPRKITSDTDWSDHLAFYNLIRQKHASAPLFVTFDLTDVPALNQKVEQGSAYQNLSSAQIKGILEQMAAIKVLKVTFLGPDLFLRRDFLSLVSYAESLNISTAAATNGAGVTASALDQLAKIPHFGLKINLDGASAATHDKLWGAGAYDQTIRAIKNSVSRKIHTTVVTYANTNNFPEIPDIIDMARDLKADVYNVRRYINLDPADSSKSLYELSSRQGEELIELQADEAKSSPTPLIIGVDPFGGNRELFSKRGVARTQKDDPYAWNTMCQSGPTYIHITSAGKVIPCTWLPVSCGDLQKEKLGAIWNNSRVLGKLRGRKSYDECIAAVYQKSGSLVGNDPLRW